MTMQKILPLILVVWTLSGCSKIENEPAVSTSTPLETDDGVLLHLEAMRIVAAPVSGDAFTLSAEIGGISLFEYQRFGAGFAYRTDAAFGAPEGALVSSEDVVVWTAHSENEHNHEWTSASLGSCRVNMAKVTEDAQVIRFPGGLIVALTWIEQ